MPVYVRKNLLSITPPSLSELLSDDDDFLTDPEQLHDQLPQPFRLVDKILSRLTDDVWEILSDREAARVAEKSRIRPPQYECAVQMQDFGKATCLADSIDGRYIFIGLPNGLAVIDAASQSKVAHWQDDNVEITSMNVCLMSVQMYLIATIDDMGACRLFCCAYEGLHLLKVLTETESATKALASNCQLSSDGDYIAITLENGSDCWVEIFRLPRDNWIREFEAAHATLLKQQHPPKPPSPVEKEKETETDMDTSHPSDGASNLDAAAGNQSQPQSPRNTSPVPAVTSTTTQSISTQQINVANLSKPTLILRIKPPAPLVGNPATSAHSAFKTIDDGSVIGSGSNHAILTQHLELRKATFNLHHEKDLQYCKEDETDGLPRQHPNVVFLNAGRLLPAGLESAATAGRPNSVAAYWSGSSNIYHYNLLKTAKDIEHKPDMLWPNASVPITCQTISSESSVNHLQFVNPSILPQSLDDYPPYPTPRASAVLVGCMDGTLRVVPCGRGSDDLSIITLSAKRAVKEELFTLIESLPAIPQIVVTVQQNGDVILYDITKGQSLCQVTLPVTHKVTSPWAPVIGIGADGQMLYVKGTQLDPNEDYVPNSGMTSLFVFQLRSFPSLDKCWKRLCEPQPHVVHVTVDKRVEDLLTERLSQQSLRQVRMQERWYKLRSEVDNIQKYRNAKVVTGDKRTV
uniref:WD repeat-containing protein 93-like n=1 Tax=Saccoglossus kowalevskii TaxID=10224 RepID=A0ABM0MML1_SACKO|nr:PREDICTED: WD repeat-containing protein 93-like [Saccoglossus kowalevskii]